MSRAKVAITLERETLTSLDQLVTQHIYPSRSRAIQEAVQEKIERLQKGRLARECANLDPKFEKALAEEGLTKDMNEWPEY